uniref:Uncharacterized protein n=1 Tax=Glossina pallidipes TaxID=7398 RepID=A0A1A9ZTD8_GLOPL
MFVADKMFAPHISDIDISNFSNWFALPVFERMFIVMGTEIKSTRMPYHLCVFVFTFWQERDKKDNLKAIDAAKLEDTDPCLFRCLVAISHDMLCEPNSTKHTHTNKLPGQDNEISLPFVQGKRKLFAGLIEINSGIFSKETDFPDRIFLTQLLVPTFKTRNQ